MHPIQFGYLGANYDVGVLEMLPGKTFLRDMP